MRFTIDEYARAYSISPEMVHSRLRRNRLNYIVEDEETFIVVPKHQVPYHVDETSSQSNEKEAAPVLEQKKTTVATVIGLYQKENRYLKLKIEELEAKVDRLIQDKEQLLKDERSRIEKVYSDKDAQLKTILELINIKLLQEGSIQENEEQALILEEQIPTPHLENTIEPVELKQHLRSLNIKSAMRKTIKRRFSDAFGSDSRILLKNGLFYLDLNRYDYSDLLKQK